MSAQIYGEAYKGNAAENYERYFVPSIGAPLARDLMEVAALRPGERVLDLACGTGLVTRLAAERVGASGTVAGLDVNPGMLAVARSLTPSGIAIDWYETSAEAMPLPDAAFDVVLCQMGLQFFPDKLGAMREVRRILAPGGRLVLNVPGPTPPLFAIMADALARHIDQKSAAFPHIVFSLHDTNELEKLMINAGFSEVAAKARTKTLELPPPDEFLWQYVHSTPLAARVPQADEAQRAVLARDVCAKWQQFMVDGTLTVPVGITTVTAQ